MSYENRICGECVTDACLRAYISASAFAEQECDYCESVRPTIAMSELADRCNDVIENFFEVSSLTDAVIHFNRDPQGEQLSALLQRLTGLSDGATEDLNDLLVHSWFDQDSGENTYGDDPYFIEGESNSSHLNTSWSRMERSLRNTSRLFNSEAAQTLQSIFGSLHQDQTCYGRPVVVNIGPGFEINSLFRARVFQEEKKLLEALKHPERYLGTRTDGKNDAGRMNAKGIGVFYGATLRRTAIAEVRPPVGAKVAVTAFGLNRILRILDLPALGNLGARPGSSYFDTSALAEASRRSFLRILSRRLVMPIMPDFAESEYLVTQAIADFLASHSILNIDGILFPSAQDSAGKEETVGMNVILFAKASRVRGAEEAFGSITEVSLWADEDECGSFFYPQIWSNPLSDDGSGDNEVDDDRRSPALVLNRDSIEISTINAVIYVTSDEKVEHHRGAGLPHWI